MGGRRVARVILDPRALVDALQHQRDALLVEWAKQKRKMDKRWGEVDVKKEKGDQYERKMDHEERRMTERKSGGE